jgi:predicted ATPase
VEEVAAHLRERRTLLVLDNFEEVVPHAATVERWLAAAPGLRVIVTSRIRLATSSEWLLPLEGLPCPEPEDCDRLDAFDAARLFVEAARRVEPALVPSIEAAAIVDICRQLEGLPLALLLAAAWTRFLSCDAIAAELRRGTELLQASDAAMPARHASMQVVFEQSWRLLTPSERDVLARLSVFRGGAQLAAVRSVTGASLAVLAALTDKSLLRKEADRFVLHPLVQQMAACKLGDGDARDAVARAHAEHFLQFLVQARAGIDKGTREALDGVAAELDNCRAAWQWAVDHGDARRILLAASPLVSFCDHRSLHGEALELLTAALAAESVQSDERLSLSLMSHTAHAQYRLDRFSDAQATAERALAAARRARDVAMRGKCVSILASCYLRLGQYDEARRRYEEALAAAQKTDNVHDVAVAYDHLALATKATGDLEGALRLSLQSLALHRRLGDHAGEALCLNNLAVLEMERGDLRAALPHLAEALAICERNGLDHPRAHVLSNLADIAFKSGDFAGAIVHTRAALALAEASGNRLVACLMRFNLVILAVRMKDQATVHADLASAMRAAIELRTPMLVLAGLYAFGELLYALGEHDGARLVLTFAADHPRASAGYRAEFLRRLAEWPQSPLPPWPGLSIDELASRIASEDEVRHAPLVAALRAPPHAS